MFFYGSPLFFCCISWLRGFPGAPQGPYGDILAIFQPMWFYKTPESQYVNICGFSRCLTRASNSLCLFPVPPEHRIIFYLKISKIMCFHKTKNYNFVWHLFLCPDIMFQSSYLLTTSSISKFPNNNRSPCEYFPTTTFSMFSISQQHVSILIFSNNHMFDLNLFHQTHFSILSFSNSNTFRPPYLPIAASFDLNISQQHIFQQHIVSKHHFPNTISRQHSVFAPGLGGVGRGNAKAESPKLPKRFMIFAWQAKGQVFNNRWLANDWAAIRNDCCEFHWQLARETLNKLIPIILEFLEKSFEHSKCNPCRPQQLPHDPWRTTVPPTLKFKSIEIHKKTKWRHA